MLVCDGNLDNTTRSAVGHSESRVLWNDAEYVELSFVFTLLARTETFPFDFALLSGFWPGWHCWVRPKL